MRRYGFDPSNVSLVLYNLTYNNSDDLFSITEKTHQGVFLLYQHPREDQSIQQLSQFIEDQLCILIPQTVVELHIKEPAFCIAISWDTEASVLPPRVSVGL